MAENGIDEKVIGISMDGVGYGVDGHIWGFEAMICDYIDFERKIHLDYIQQPGGDKANQEPWRMALAFLLKYASDDGEIPELPFLENIGQEKRSLVRMAIEKNINSPLTSSAGRLFDAVAAMTGLCNFASFHSEAPMRLENAMDVSETGAYDFHLDKTINPGLIIIGIVHDIQNKIPVSKISAKFHRTIVMIIVEIALRLRKETGISKIVLSGGTFQNRFLLSESVNYLKKNEFTVFSQGHVPSNDGGIALGQLAIAAKRRAAGLLNQPSGISISY
jgi:hydrogenase maturation protein HypF